MNKKIIIGICSIVILALTFFIGANTHFGKQERYTMYVGLNDKSGKQILNKEEASQKIRAIFIKNGAGYTEYNAFGAYPDDKGVHENDTLVYELYFLEEKTVNQIASEVKKELNLDSIFMEKDYTQYDYAE